MVNRTVIEQRLTYWRQVYAVTQQAYIDLLEGKTKSYMVEDRQLSYQSINDVLAAMKNAEKMIDELEAASNGKKPRKAFGVIPRDW